MPIATTRDEQLPFQEAIDYLAGKTNLDTDSWIEGQGLIQTVAFTVAGAKGRVLQDIRNAVDRAIQDGISIRDFAKQFNAIADSYVDNWQLKGDRAWRGQLIYEQNLRQAYGAGRYAQMTDPDVLNRRPYWQWAHGDSRAPRPVHLALDGKVFPANSLPFFVPCGFGCKCQVFSLSQRDVDREGLQVEHLEHGQDIDYTDPNGQTRTAQLLPDPGFDWKPTGKLTKERQTELLKGLDPDIRKLVLGDTEAEFAKKLEGTTRQVNGVTYVLRKSRWRRDEEQGVEKRNYDLHVEGSLLSIIEGEEINHFYHYSSGSWKGFFSESNADRGYDFIVPEAFRDRILTVAQHPTQQAVRELMSDLSEAKAKGKRAAIITLLTNKFQQDVAKLPDKPKAAESRTVGDKFIADLMALSDRDLAEKRSHAIDMSSDVPSKDLYPITKHFSDFFQLIDKNLDIKSISVEGDRSCAGRFDKVVELSTAASERYRRECIFHEAAHFIEFDDPVAGEANYDWIGHRASGDAKPLRELTKHDYDHDEFAFPDQFIDPYVGKVCIGKVTEVYAMGLERFSDGRKLVELAKKDPDHFQRSIDYLKK
jgi:Phage Mu protein F like protein